MLQIWDTAGQERFRTITSSYYRGAQGIILVFDLTNEESFININKWMIETNKYCLGGTKKLLIGNKCDLVDQRVINFETAKDLAECFGINYIEVSAKSAIGIDECFLIMAELIYKETEIIKDPPRTDVYTKK